MEETKKKRHHIILVHGACHGAWCWYKVATILTERGHKVTVPDLAASGIDARRVKDVSNFGEYSQPLFEVMASLPAEEKVVLVGHSYGGISIAMAMEMFPERVAVACFVAAFMPDFAHSVQYVLEQHHLQHPWIHNDMMDSVMSNDTFVKFGPKIMAAKLYQLSPPEDLALAKMLVRPLPPVIADPSTLPSFSEDRHGSVDTTYIICRDDNIVPAEYQRWMIQNYAGRVKDVAEIDGADHMAMFSKPIELCQSLLRVIDDNA